MDSNVVALIIGLAGIAGTVIASSLGLYFTAKARSAPLREMLYSKQIEIITQLIHKQERFRIYATILSGKDTKFKDVALDDINKCIKEYSELTEKAVALLPTDLWIEIKKLTTFMTELINTYDETLTIDENSLLKLAGMDTKIALASRVVLGIDELTEESIKLFSSVDSLERITQIESDYFEALAKKEAQ